MKWHMTDPYSSVCQILKTDIRDKIFRLKSIKIVIIGFLKQFEDEKDNLLPAPFEVNGAPPKMVFTNSGSPIDLVELLFSSFSLPSGGVTSFFDGRVF